MLFYRFLVYARYQKFHFTMQGGFGRGKNNKINKWLTRTGSYYLWKMSVVYMTLNLIKCREALKVTELYLFMVYWLMKINCNIDKNSWTIHLMNNWMDKNIICSYFEIQQLEIGMRIHRPIICQHFIKQPVLTVKVTRGKIGHKIII